MAWPVRQTSLPLLAAVLLAWATSPALGGEAKYCVTCKNPDQTYLCQVSAGGKKPSDALKLYCVMRVAKEGQHSSCSAEKAKGPCDGLVKLYSYDGPMPEDIAAGIQQFSDKVNDRIRKEQRAFEKPKSDQPDTLVKLTGRAVSAARTRIGRGSGGDEPPPPDDSLYASPAPPEEAALPPYVEDSGPNRVQRASSAVGGFARKSYRCVFSLFRNCSEEAAAGETLR